MKSLPSAPGKTTGEHSLLNSSRNSGPGPVKTPWEDPEILAVPIPAEQKALLDSLQDAGHDVLWLIESNTGAKLSGPALDQFKTQAEALSKSIKTLPSQVASLLQVYKLHPTKTCLTRRTAH
jgi:hypothetical protein